MRTFLITITFGLMLGCGGADIGEDCDDVGSGDECVSNAVCTNEADGASRCREVCEDDDTCPAMHHCNGVSGTSTKSCQPD